MLAPVTGWVMYSLVSVTYSAKTVWLFNCFFPTSRMRRTALRSMFFCWIELEEEQNKK